MDRSAGRTDRPTRPSWGDNRLGGGIIVLILALALIEAVRPARLGAQPGPEVPKQVILKFGSYYINTDQITHIRLAGPEQNGKTLVYFTGDSRAPLELTRKEGDMMRPWLDGHALDLSTPPDPNPLPSLPIGSQ